MKRYTKMINLRVPNKIRNEREMTTDTTEIQKVVRKYNEKLYANI